MCCFHIWALPERGRGWGVKACQDGLEHFFPHVCPFDRGGVLKLFWQCPYRTNTFQKRASLRYAMTCSSSWKQIFLAAKFFQKAMRNFMYLLYTIVPKICYTTTSGFYCFFGSFQSISELLCCKFCEPSKWGYVSHTNNAFSWDNLRTESILDKCIDFALVIAIALIFRIFWPL